jgi:hypothetical protein
MDKDADGRQWKAIAIYAVSCCRALFININFVFLSAIDPRVFKLQHMSGIDFLQ